MVRRQRWLGGSVELQSESSACNAGCAGRSRATSLGLEVLEDRRLLAAAPQLVDDIHTTTLSSFPLALTDMNGDAYFVALDPETGFELWKSDGTAGGTNPIVEIIPGPQSSYPIPVGVLDDTMFFRGITIEGQQSLWKTDGTDSGTVRVKDIVPELFPYLYFQYHFSQSVVFEGELYFPAWEETHGHGLWRTDGTSEGTVRIPGATSPQQLTVVGDELFFIGDDSVFGRELWKTDGTEVGTTMVKDIAPGFSSSLEPFSQTYIGGGVYPSLFEFGGELYFTPHNVPGSDENYSLQLWKSDGTESGTHMVSSAAPNLLPSDNPFGSPSLAAVGERLYFVVEGNAPDTSQLWSTDGTEIGTQQVEDVPQMDNLSNYSAGISDLIELDGLLYFAVDREESQDVWRTDGSSEGTTVVYSFNEASNVHLDKIGQQLIVSDAPISRPKKPRLWASDGTAAGTQLLLETDERSLLTRIGNELYFAAEDNASGIELWKTDGTVDGTQRVADIVADRTESSTPGELTVVGDRLYFLARTADEGNELWASDGTTAGTQLVKDTQAGETGLHPYANNPLVEGPAGLLFFSSAGLWRSDGTDAGTFPLGGGDSAEELAFFADRMFFVTDDGIHGNELWVSDGTLVGTELFIDLNSGPSGSAPSELTVFDDALFFVAQGALWRTDGTIVGTEQILSSGVQRIFAVEDQLFLTIDDPSIGSELWVSDGTSAGTQVVADIHPLGGGSDPFGLGAFGEKLFFRTEVGRLNFEIWISDGTSAGTESLGKFNLGPNTNAFEVLGEIDGKLFFGVPAGIYKTDGTSAGTEPFLDLEVLPSSSTTLFRDGQTLMYFTAVAPDGTGGLWQSDGTNEGTILVDAFEPFQVQSSSRPARVTTFDDAVYYTRTDPVVGRELFRFDPDAPNTAPTVSISAPEVVVRGLEQTILLTANDTAPDEVAGFTWHIDWDLDGTADETFFDEAEVVLTHTFAQTDSPTFQVWVVDQEFQSSSVVQATVDIRPFAAIRDPLDNGRMNLIYGGTAGLDSVFFLPAGPDAIQVFRQFENSSVVNQFERIDNINGRVIAYAQESSVGDLLVAEFLAQAIEFLGSPGDDTLVGGVSADTIYGGGGNDTILGGTRHYDSGDLLMGGAGKDTLFGHYGADTLDGGAGEDLLISDGFHFGNVALAVQKIANEWKSSRPYAERVSNIQGITSTGVNGPYHLEPGTTIFPDQVEDLLIGGIGDLDWFFYDFDLDLLGDVIEVDEEETDSDP